ncbi:hypothetical protein ACOI1C_06170 [Bacillus sp. DJP31]|uniref:hypothetical protein n=1 Tax=Bacillus sp. DJP31 TaxID=3409789 RepID=UPI003BB54EEF
MTPGVSFGTQWEGYVRIALIHDEHRLGRAVKMLKDSQIINGLGRILKEVYSGFQTNDNRNDAQASI